VTIIDGHFASTRYQHPDRPEPDVASAVLDIQQVGGR
jgi:hypothetical protein